MIAIGHPVVKFNRRGPDYIHIDTSLVSELEIVLRSERSYVRC